MARRTGADGRAYGLTVSTGPQGLLLENGDQLVTESGDRIILE